MKYNELNISSGKSKRRVGRGIAAGQGKTAGRGTKGQGSRAGSKFGSTFMGGQGPLVQRIPKFKGFRSLRVKAQTIYTDQLNDIEGATHDNMSLYESGLLATPYHTAKLIVRGQYKGKATVKLQAASKGAVAMLEKAGGKFEATDLPKLPASNAKRAEKRADKATKKAEK